MMFVPGPTFRMVGRLMSLLSVRLSEFDGRVNHALILHRNKSLRHEDGHLCNKQIEHVCHASYPRLPCPNAYFFSQTFSLFLPGIALANVCGQV